MKFSTPSLLCEMLTLNSLSSSLFVQVLLSSIFPLSDLSVITAYNLTPLKRYNRQMARFCVQQPFSGRTHRRSQL